MAAITPQRARHLPTHLKYTLVVSLYKTSGFVLIVTLCTNSALCTLYTLFPVSPLSQPLITKCYDIGLCCETTQDSMSEVTIGKRG